MSTTIGEWSKWESTRWTENGYRYERTRTVRSWFGYLRQERERITLPYLSSGIGEALLNGANYAYGETLEMMQKDYEERRQALIAAREAHHKAVMEISALKQSLTSMSGVAAQAIRSLEAKEQECERLKAAAIRTAAQTLNPRGKRRARR